MMDGLWKLDGWLQMDVKTLVPPFMQRHGGQHGRWDIGD
jgi:hypothetical protein